MLIFLSHRNLTVKTTDGRLLSRCFEERLSQETGEKCIVLDWCAGVFRTDGDQESLTLDGVTWDLLNCPGCDQTADMERVIQEQNNKHRADLRRMNVLIRMLAVATVLNAVQLLLRSFS